MISSSSLPRCRDEDDLRFTQPRRQALLLVIAATFQFIHRSVRARVHWRSSRRRNAAFELPGARLCEPPQSITAIVISEACAKGWLNQRRAAIGIDMGQIYGGIEISRCPRSSFLGHLMRSDFYKTGFRRRTLDASSRDRPSTAVMFIVSNIAKADADNYKVQTPSVKKELTCS